MYKNTKYHVYITILVHHPHIFAALLHSEKNTIAHLKNITLCLFWGIGHTQEERTKVPLAKYLHTRAFIDNLLDEAHVFTRGRLIFMHSIICSRRVVGSSLYSSATCELWTVSGA